MAGNGAPIASDTVVRATTQHVSVDLGEEILILHLSTAGYYSVRNVAARIWALLQEPVRVSEIGAALAREYGVPRARCEPDAVELLEALQARDLLEIAP